LRAQRSNQG